MRALIGALLLVGYGWLTHHRLEVWRTDDALWQEAHARSSTLPRPMLNLGAAALRRGATQEAEAWWTEAEATGRLTVFEHTRLRRMRCDLALLYDRRSSVLPDSCSPSPSSTHGR